MCGRGFSFFSTPPATVPTSDRLWQTRHEDVQEMLEADKAARRRYPYHRGMTNNTFYLAWRTFDEVRPDLIVAEAENCSSRDHFHRQRSSRTALAAAAATACLARLDRILCGDHVLWDAGGHCIFWHSITVSAA